MSSQSNIDTLMVQSSRLFEQVMPLRTRQQEIAENFYPERADFTSTNNLGTDYAAHLTTSYPLSVRRDLANIFSTMLRPQEKVWAKMSTRNFEDLGEDSKRWLEWATHLQRNAMYDQDSGFQRATAQSDEDVACFGQCVISCEMNWRKHALLFRNWHLRDVVWSEDADGKVGRVDRRWMATASDLNIIFKGNIHEKMKECLTKEPYKEFEIRHMFIPIDQYDNGKGWHKKSSFKYVSIFYDIANKFILEERPYKHKYYIVPRWKTLSGSQYAYSPAALAALPDARLLQDMMLVMLEAGQKAVDPPMLAIQDVLRSDANLYAGGITAVDAEYDERLGSPLRPVFDSRSTNIPLGIEIMEGVRQSIRDAHFLNKMGLPPMGSGMSQMEISERVSEYVRGALPLFQPLEPEYNGQLCELAFEVMFHNDGFGPPQSIPEELLGKTIEFKFENPLRDSTDRIKGAQLLEAAAMLNNMGAFDPTVPRILDAHEATRDAIDGIGAPRKWFKTKEQVQAEVAQDEEQAAMMQTMAALQQGAETATQLGVAGQELQKIQ